MCANDDKYHNSLEQGCDNIKFNRHVKDNRNGFANHVLAAPGLGFDLSIEYKKPNDAILSAKRCLM